MNTTIPGIVNLECKDRVAETVSRLETLLSSKGLKIFCRIDQGEEAAMVGLQMRPMVLIIFGDPKLGIPLMIKYPSLAIDVPFKALVWEAADGKVWLTYNTPESLEERHGLKESPFGAMVDILKAAV